MSQSLDRGLSLLTALAGGASTLDELAAQLGVHKSTVLRLLRTLETQHFVQREGARRYRLGSALFDLANRALEVRDVRRGSAPALAALNDRTGHSVHLATYEDGEVVYVDKYEGRHSVRMYSRVGKRAPLHCTAEGKVLVAAMTPAQRSKIAHELDYPAMTVTTITSAEVYLAELEKVAERGYAVDDAEHQDFIHCIAAPVRGQDGTVLAAVSLSVPKVLLDHDGLLALLPDLRAAAEDASIHNGWTPGERNPSMAKVAISTDNAPKPVANYSPAVRKGNILQLAGQVAVDPKTGEVVGDSVGEQTRQVFANLDAVLAEAGADWADVVMVRAYLTDTGHFAEFNEVYNQLIPEPYPARTTVYVGLPAGLLVEIDLLAVVD